MQIDNAKTRLFAFFQKINDLIAGLFETGKIFDCIVALVQKIVSLKRNRTQIIVKSANEAFFIGDIVSMLLTT